MKKRFFLGYLAASLILAGCVPAASSVAGEGGGTRIIIKFSAMRDNPAERDFVERLSRDVGAELVYLRPMSGGAHVFEVRGVHDTAELQAVLARLNKHPGIDHVEQDRVLRRQ